jgi:5'-methylthioadenosine phosphorylase
MREDVYRDSRVLYDNMHRFWGLFGHRMSLVLAAKGVNLPQYAAMVALKDGSESTMSELSRRLRVTMGASTNIADKLVRAGLVVRSRDDGDRRVVRVRLEQKGIDVLREAEEQAVAFMAELLERLGPEERSQLVSGYGRMLAFAEAREQAEGGAGIG